MNREIKFRVWDNSDKIMRTVHQLNCKTESNLTQVSTDVGCFEVPWEFIIQYTGLKDKNGVEIYEGDTIKLSNDQIGVVFYDDLSGASFDVDLRDGKYALLGLGTSVVSFKAFVIGNIYENPELLAESQK